MEANAKRAVERGLAWCGPLFVVTIIVTWGIMGDNIPPPNMMAMTGEQLVTDYYASSTSIAPGYVLAATFGLFYTVWSCLLASLMRDEQGAIGTLGLIELSGGILTGWLFAFCSMIWATAAVLYTQVSPDIVKTLHTMAWFIFDCTYMITTIQMVALGLWTVLNKRQTMFPAWAGWTSAAIGVGFVPLVFIPFVSEGPFAVPGLWNFWVIFTAWIFAFFGVYNYYVLRHVYRSPEAQERAAGRLQTA